MAEQTLTLKVLAPEDEPAFLKLHQEVFGSSADPVWFDWKYKLGKAVGIACGVKIAWWRTAAAYRALCCTKV